MLPKRLRLPLRKEGNFFDKAKRFYCDGITSFFIQNTQDLKFSVIAKKSDFPLSTTRHNLVRRTHQAIEKIILNHPKYLGHYTFILSKNTLTSSIDIIQKTLQKHLKISQS